MPNDAGPIKRAVAVLAVVAAMMPLATASDAVAQSPATPVGSISHPDFNGDGRSDVFWYAPGAGADSIWFADGSGTSFSSREQPVRGHYVPIAGDFNGDGRSDVFWYAPGAAADSIWLSTGPGFASAEQSVRGQYTPVGAAGREAPIPSTAVFATISGVPIHLPSGSTRFVGFHQSGDRTMFAQDPQSSGVPWSTLPSRNRGTHPRSAADLVQAPGVTILAPVTGTVIRSHSYLLYCAYPDELVFVAPDDTRLGEVRVLHLVGRKVNVGDRVIGGVTPIANSARRFPFASQVDLRSGYPTAAHAHIEGGPRGSALPTSVYC